MNQFASHKISTVFCVAVLCVCLGASTPRCVGQVAANSALPVAYCDLVRDPRAYDGKLVAVQATYRYGEEWQELLCMECRDVGKTWLEFDSDSITRSKSELRKLPKNHGLVNGQFIGTFHSSGGRFGDGGYAFKFVVKEVKNITIVARSGWELDLLSESVSSRVCNNRKRN